LDDMSESLEDATQLRLFLRRAGDGDPSAVDALFGRTAERLRLLARRMLRRFPGVRRWAETDDVLQNALVRMLSALRAVKPESVRDYLALANLQIRRELIDLARRFHGPEGIGANHDSHPDDDAHPPRLQQAPDAHHDPASLVQWSELHEHIGALPDEEREIVELLFYQGMSQAEAAEVLDVSVRTIQRRWHAALVALHEVWHRCVPLTSDG
jgi:RNA polymerase sigma-70 factor (ECF subfamily)